MCGAQKVSRHFFALIVAFDVIVYCSAFEIQKDVWRELSGVNF